MKKDNKKALYESIMTAIAKEVKKVLNEEQQKNNLFNKVKKFGKYTAKKPMPSLAFVCGDMEILYNEKCIIDWPDTPEKVKNLINFTIPEGFKGCGYSGDQPFQLFMRCYLSNGLAKEFKNDTDYTYFNKFNLLFSTNNNKIGIAYERPEGQLIFLNAVFYDFSKAILTNIILLLDQTIDKILKEFDLNSSFMWEFDEKSRILHKNNPTSKYIKL